MFQFGRFPSLPYVFRQGFTTLHRTGFPIRTSAGQCLFPTRRGFSQVITSFFGFQCQGILLTLFFAWTAFLFLFSFRKTFYASFAWASQIIVFGLWLKRPFWFSFTFLSALKMNHLQNWRNCFLPFDTYGKTFYHFCFIITSFSHNYLFRFFSLFGFQWTPSFFEKKEGKETSVMRFAHMISVSGRPKWTRTTDLVLIRHAL